MELTAKRRSDTGAFYTPGQWAKLAVEYLFRSLGDYHGFCFYDPAAGEGSLLSALPDDAEKLGSTLEYDDVKIMEEKGLVAYQCDFLRPEWPLPDQAEVRAEQGRLIILTNPPFCKLRSGQYEAMKRKYGTNDTVQLFILRCLNELKPVFYAGFNKMDIFQSPMCSGFRQRIDLEKRYLNGFASPSSSWGLSGNFPIMFNVLLGEWTPF